MTRRIVLVSGLSGAGKASVLRILEDLGYEAVDNPPLTLVEALVGRGSNPLAIGLDARSRGFDAGLVLSTLAALKARATFRPELVYVWAEEAVLLRRYTDTRRRHPLAPSGRVVDGIAAETKLTWLLREAADLVVDTSNLPLPDLRRLIEWRFSPHPSAARPGLVIQLVSFAFPAGLPREADMIFDARFLRNPHYDPILRPGTGLDTPVAAYVQADPDYAAFLGKMTEMLEFVLPRFVQEGKKYVTIGIGCTGGRHRSVCLVEQLARSLTALAESGRTERWQVTRVHRELLLKGRSGSAADPVGLEQAP